MGGAGREDGRGREGGWEGQGVRMGGAGSEEVGVVGGKEGSGRGRREGGSKEMSLLCVCVTVCALTIPLCAHVCMCGHVLVAHLFVVQCVRSKNPLRSKTRL